LAGFGEEAGFELEVFIINGLTTDGATSAIADISIPNGAAEFLRVTRTGDQWTLEYAADGQTYTQLATFNAPLTVTAVGPFAASAGSNPPGFDAQVDYVFNTAAPIVPEDGVSSPPVNTAPVAVNDMADTDENQPVTIDVLANDTDAQNDPLMVTEATALNGQVTINPDETITYTPNAGFTGTDTITYTVSDGALSDQANVAVTVASEPPTGVGSFISDDFNATTINAAWSFDGVAGSVGLNTSPTDAFVEINAPVGAVVSASDLLTTPRLMQAADDTDFQFSAGFLTEPTTRFQEQGVLVVQDDENFIRFDVAFTSTGLNLLVGVIDNGNTTFALFERIDSGDVTDFRVTRDGDVFTFEYSNDRVTWIQATQLTEQLTVSEVGVFAGSAGGSGETPPGYTAQVDYFENSAIPIVGEDSTFTPPTNTAPMAVDDVAETDEDEAVTIDVLANDTDAQNDTLMVTEATALNGQVTINPDETITYTPNPGFTGTDTITYTVDDGALTDQANVAVTVNLVPPPSDFISDDFNASSLQSFWRFDAPNGGSFSIEDDGNDAYVRLVAPPGVDTDPFNDFDAVSILQPISDEDFQLVANFRTLPDPDERFQGHGFLIVEDEDNYVRLDIFSRGTPGRGELFAFGGVTVDGETIIEFNIIELPTVDHARNLRITRDGDTWSLETSADAVNWTLAGSFDAPLNVTEAGVFGGSISSPISESPGYIAEVDFVFNTASPIVPEDGDSAPPLTNTVLDIARLAPADDELFEEASETLETLPEFLIAEPNAPDTFVSVSGGSSAPLKGIAPLVSSGAPAKTVAPEAGPSGPGTLTPEFETPDPNASDFDFDLFLA
ncbi:MAG: Ig-like domain-containing protein, partial [Pseudomonadota bacterium]